MRILLDTHAFLWFILDDPRLSLTARKTIADPDCEVLISPASHWEVAIKISLGINMSCLSLSSHSWPEKLR